MGEHGGVKENTSRRSLIAAASVSVIAFAIVGWSGITSYLRVPQARPTILDPARIFTTSSFPPATVTAPTSPGRPIEIRWRATDLAPAANAGHICVTDRVRGQICADYAVGQRPADTLTSSLQSLGLRVQPDG